MKLNNELIKLSDITKDYVTEDITTKALNGISLTVKKGEFIAVTGRSGSGKSTLMNILGLLDTPTTGKYVLNGTDVSRMGEDTLSSTRNKEIGFVFQSFNLLPRATALENVILPAIYAGISLSDREKRGKEVLND